MLSSVRIRTAGISASSVPRTDRVAGDIAYFKSARRLSWRRIAQETQDSCCPDQAARPEQKSGSKIDEFSAVYLRHISIPIQALSSNIVSKSQAAMIRMAITCTFLPEGGSQRPS